MKLKKHLFAAMMIAAVLCFVAGCGSFNMDGKYEERQGFYFDTEVSVRIYGKDAGKQADAVMARCAELEKVFSPTDPESELYKVNHRTSDTVEISEELAACLKASLEVRAASDGAFEPAIRPLSELWEAAREKEEVPAREAVEEARARTGGSVELSGRTLHFEDPETRLDLGAAAKGYISGLLKEELKKAGVTSALLNLGGNVSLLGEKPDGSAYKVGVQEPFSDRGTLLFTAEVSDACVISSGVYERFFEADGVRYHHILSIETGMPADTGLTQVTVIGPDDLYGDIYSTLFMLLGEEDARAFIKARALPGTFIFTREDGQVVLFNADGLEKEIRKGESIRFLPGGVYEEE